MLTPAYFIELVLRNMIQKFNLNNKHKLYLKLFINLKTDFKMNALSKEDNNTFKIPEQKRVLRLNF